jgi:hypothetical protein
VYIFVGRPLKSTSDSQSYLLGLLKLEKTRVSSRSKTRTFLFCFWGGRTMWQCCLLLMIFAMVLGRSWSSI